MKHDNRVPVNGTGTLDTSIWTGYLIRPKGDMRRYTLRMYETLQEASGRLRARRNRATRAASAKSRNRSNHPTTPRITRNPTFRPGS